jgi:predicted metal-dependent hydrolase
MPESKCPLPQILSLPSGDVEIRIRRSQRARRIALRMSGNEDAVELVLPERVPLSLGLDFLASRRNWIAARHQAVPPQIPFADGAEIPVLGVPHRIRHLAEETRGSGGAIRLAAGEILVSGAAPHLARRVRDHLILLARREIGAHARHHASAIGCDIAGITLRDTRSRWGSCSVSGNLSFSWRLVLAPEPVLDYVVAHEVAHLVHMNHGDRFWQLVASLSPDYATHRSWLRLNRARLMRYG